jgi:hypothetical protein
VTDHPPRYLLWLAGSVRAACDCHYWEPVVVGGAR